VFKFYESPFSCFGNNPTINIDKGGLDSTVAVRCGVGQDDIEYSERTSYSIEDVTTSDNLPKYVQNMQNKAFSDWDNWWKLNIADNRKTQRADIKVYKVSWTETKIVTHIKYIPLLDEVTGSEIGIKRIEVESKKIVIQHTQYFVKTDCDLVNASSGFVEKALHTSAYGAIESKVLENKNIDQPGTFEPLITACISTRLIKGKSTHLNYISGLEDEIENAQQVGQLCDKAGSLGAYIAEYSKIKQLQAAGKLIEYAGGVGSFVSQLIEGDLQVQHSAMSGNTEATYNTSALGNGYFNRITR
jgi:hypothetical protein